ncbi:UNVERIFIED_CONTAM: helix-turn-helix transcriptional regulator, partial [Prevotella sp. 15_C9]
NRRLARTEADTLTRSELAVAELVARGLSTAEIARQLDLQIDTVKKYLTRVYQALGVRSRTQLALRLR